MKQMICGTCRSNNMLETMKNSEEVLKKLWLLKLPSHQSFKYEQSKSKRASHFSNPPAMLAGSIKGVAESVKRLRFMNVVNVTQNPSPLHKVYVNCRLEVGGCFDRGDQVLIIIEKGPCAGQSYIPSASEKFL